MKKQFLFLVFPLLLINANVLIAQQTTNWLTESEFKAISFNGRTVAQLNATNGHSESLIQLMGTCTSVEVPNGMRKSYYHFGANHISYDYDTPANHLTSITITNNQWPVVIKGNTIRVGDTETQLRQVFGTSLIFVNSQHSNTRYVFFSYLNNDWDSVAIVVNPGTQKVVEIEYYINP
jgi:hypothetical protein